MISRQFFFHGFPPEIWRNSLGRGKSVSWNIHLPLWLWPVSLTGSSRAAWRYISRACGQLGTSDGKLHMWENEQAGDGFLIVDEWKTCFEVLSFKKRWHYSIAHALPGESHLKSRNERGESFAITSVALSMGERWFSAAIFQSNEGVGSSSTEYIVKKIVGSEELWSGTPAFGGLLVLEKRNWMPEGHLRGVGQLRRSKLKSSGNIGGLASLLGDPATSCGSTPKSRAPWQVNKMSKDEL